MLMCAQCYTDSHISNSIQSVHSNFQGIGPATICSSLCKLTKCVGGKLYRIRQR